MTMEDKIPIRQFEMGHAPFKAAGVMPEMPEADISAMYRRALDIPYGRRHSRQVFDIYYPEHGDGPFPVLLHMHGGGFAMGDKRDFHITELLEAVKRGYALVSCNYRRSGDAPFPAAVLDCRACVDFLHRNAEKLMIDADRICAFGGSAGGNLSALFAMDIEKFIGEDEPVNASVACAVDWFGPTDFRRMDEQARENKVSIADHDSADSPESQYMGGPLQDIDSEFIEKANPITYISRRMRPLLLQHGTMDKLVPFQQSEMLYTAINSKLGKDRVIFLPLENAGHDDPAFKCSENMAVLWAFLDKYLKNIEPPVPFEKMPIPKGGAGGDSTVPFGLPPEFRDDVGPAGIRISGPDVNFAGAVSFAAAPRSDGRMGDELQEHPQPPALAQSVLDGISEKYLDISYCTDSPSQKLDIYMPNVRDDKPCPVIVHFHGGAFMGCTKRDDSVEPMLRGLDRGYAVVSAEYRKSGEARFPAMVYDAKAVVRWVRAHAEEYGLDPEHIAVWGPSSGGWLASFTAVTNGNGSFEDLSQGWGDYSSIAQACIDWCGPCGGFLNMDKDFIKSGSGAADHSQPDSPESLFLGAPITSVPELVRLADPRSHIREDVPPFMIVHGGADQVVPVEQSERFYDAIIAKAGKERAELHIAPGKPHHGDPWYHERWVSDMCLDFLDKCFER